MYDEEMVNYGTISKRTGGKTVMAIKSELNTKIMRSMKTLADKQKRELLKFIEYLKMRENASFIAYVNERTRHAVEAKQQGEHFTGLTELQEEYAQKLSS